MRHSATCGSHAPAPPGSAQSRHRRTVLRRTPVPSRPTPGARPAVRSAAWSVPSRHRHPWPWHPERQRPTRYAADRSSAPAAGSQSPHHRGRDWQVFFRQLFDGLRHHGWRFRTQVTCSRRLVVDRFDAWQTGLQRHTQQHDHVTVDEPPRTVMGQQDSCGSGGYALPCVSTAAKWHPLPASTNRCHRLWP